MIGHRYGWYPYTQVKFGHRDTHTGRGYVNMKMATDKPRREAGSIFVPHRPQVEPTVPIP